jgi:hypothetical protein
VIEALTPQQALDMYRANIEQFDQAAPMLVADDGEQIGFTQIADMEVADGLAQMVLDGSRYHAVLLSAETRVTSYDLHTGQAETEGPVDAAMFTYADANGKTWSALQRFMRVNGKVTYLGDLEVSDLGFGAVQDRLRQLVGAR